MAEIHVLMLRQEAGTRQPPGVGSGDAYGSRLHVARAWVKAEVEAKRYGRAWQTTREAEERRTCGMQSMADVTELSPESQWM